MTKPFRFLAIFTIGVAFATSSTARAQTYTSVDYPAAILTELVGGPNPQGTSVGIWEDTSSFFHGITYHNGVFTSVNVPNSLFTEPTWISPQGVIVGLYFDSSVVSHGFILKGGNYTTVDFPGALFTELSSINPSGSISGAYSSENANPVCNGGSTGACHSFLLSKKGRFTSFDPPRAASSTASTVNPSGEVFGAYNDSAGVGHGYVLRHGMYATVDFPGAILTFIGAGNPEGDSAGEYIDTSNVPHAFLLSNGDFTSFDFPGAIATGAAGINPGKTIVGFWVDASGNVHGFVRTP